MTSLPIDSFIPEINQRLRESSALVLVAEPGAGKTTRVPPGIIRAGLLSKEHSNLVMLQPRRVAARAAAQRIAEENGWELGREAGYHVRFDRKLSRETRIRVLTEGILTRQLLDDPFLEGIGAVLLDEFHERSLHTDMAIALLREVQQTVRDDLKLVVMSATLDAEPVAKFLGDCPIVRVPGRTFPVEINHSSMPIGAITKRSKLVEEVSAAVGEAIEHPDCGDVLVFLPGVEEIRRTMHALEPLARRDDLLVLPLHGSLQADEQMLALRPAKRRKIVLATNIAETSLTIDGVRTVIDAGLARVAGYDPQRGLDRLELKRISKASATQRAGRAGRTAPGRAIRLWSAKEHHAMPEFELPEIRRVDLCSTVLSLHAWGKSDPRDFGWYEPPDERALLSAERLLAMLGALTRQGQITPLGQKLASLPVHPRLARLLLAASDVGALQEAATIAALLSEKDIAPIDASAGRATTLQGPSDLLVRMQWLAEAEHSRFAAHLRDRGIDPNGARQVARTRDELLRICRRIVDANASQKGDASEEQLLKLALLAYPDRVCRRRANDPSAGTMVGGGGVRLAAESVVRQGEFFLALDARQDQRSIIRESLVHIASRIEAAWLEQLFPISIRSDREVVFDEQRQRVVGRGTVWYRDLLLSEDKDAAVDAVQAGRVLAEALRPRVRQIVTSDESAASILARVELLREHMPEHPWPALEDEQLAEVLADAATGKRSMHELEKVNWTSLLQSHLHYPLDRLLEEHAPTTITVPSGSRIRITYAPGQPPILAVRLQEIFGWTDTPRIAGGRLPLLIHLLSPGFRPVQVTSDLRSFWSTTYFQVRKDLRVRYPKHAWPENPLTAKAVAKGRHRQ